jgi:hypothetical protein
MLIGQKANHYPVGGERREISKSSLIHIGVDDQYVADRAAQNLSRHAMMLRSAWRVSSVRLQLRLRCEEG